MCPVGKEGWAGSMGPGVLDRRLLEHPPPRRCETLEMEVLPLSLTTVTFIAQFLPHSGFSILFYI